MMSFPEGCSPFPTLSKTSIGTELVGDDPAGLSGACHCTVRFSRATMQSAVVSEHCALRIV